MFDSLPRVSIKNDGGAGHTELEPTFRILRDPDRPSWLAIVPSHFDHPSPADILWSGQIESEELMAGVLEHLHENPSLLCVWGRIACSFDPKALNGLVGRLVEEIDLELREAEEERLEEERARLQVNCYVGDARNAYTLSLTRRSEPKEEWTITFRGRAERERLRDWLRWQEDRFAEFLEYAEREGHRSLERRLVDEMYETEARVKKAGRGAGGLRPLRMWRGEA